ncbi:MAG: hypothetical protein AAFN41_09445, partial [Planctomycetota bacterium]
MFVIPLVALAATPQPVHQTIDQPFEARASSIEGITELHATRDWHVALGNTRSVLINDFFLDSDT